MQIVIPFAQVDAVNPNLPEENLKESIAKYFRCIMVACYSFRFHNPKIRILVLTNQNIPREFQDILKSLQVNLQILEFTYNPPLEFGQNFRGCFFIFDALNALSENSLIIDPDVVCLENLDQMVSQLGNRISVFKPGFPANKIINGISPNTANEIFNIYSNKFNLKVSEHLGGEAIYIPKDSIKNLAKESSKLWEWNIQRAKNGLPYLTTEEHILSVLLRDTEYDSLSPYISRIWTSKKYKEIEGAVKDINRLALWHLPSEKNNGFQSIYYSLFSKKNIGKLIVFDKSYVSKKMNLNLNLLRRVTYRLIRNF
jgi:hypothetical protein